MLDRLDAQGSGHMALAGSGATNKHDIIGAIHKIAAVQLTDQGLVHLTGGKVEAGQILVGGKRAALIW